MNTSRGYWALAIAGAAILAITMGIRQSLGLFVSPLNTSTGLGIVTISFTLAVGQFVWGATQPAFGALADRVGNVRVIAAGAVLLAAGLVGTTLVDSSIGLLLFLGIVTTAGAGAGSFSILMSAAANRLPPERRSPASGVINAGGPFGPCVFAPLPPGRHSSPTRPPPDREVVLRTPPYIPLLSSPARRAHRRVDFNSGCCSSPRSSNSPTGQVFW